MLMFLIKGVNSLGEPRRFREAILEGSIEMQIVKDILRLFEKDVLKGNFERRLHINDGLCF